MALKIPTTQAEIVLHRFGGRQPMHRITGLPLHKIDSAKHVGYFQHTDQALILEKAQANGVPLTPLDFIAHLANLVPAATG